MRLTALDAVLRRFGVQPPPAPAPAGPGVPGDRARISPAAREALAKAPAPTHLTGSFLQFGEPHDAAYWARTLADMQAVGMDTAIIQYTQYDGTNFGDQSELVLSAADQLGMKVYVGTALNEGMASLGTNWYLKQFLPWAVKREGAEVAAYTRALVQQYAHHPSFTGVYIPFEVNALAPAKPIGDFYGAISQAAKAERPDLKVMISPYTAIQPAHAASMPAGWLALWWDTVLSRAHLDVLAWQDGVGGAPTRLQTAVGPDLAALEQATARHGVELWADLESFQRTSAPSQPFQAGPEALDTLVAQIGAEAPHVRKLVNFDFNHYMSPQAGPAAARLYQDYRAHLRDQGLVR